MFLKYCGCNTFFFFFNSPPDFGNHNFFFLPFSVMALPQKKISPISAMALPQTNCNIFFSSYFSNATVTSQLQHFFFPPILAMPLPQIHSTIFFFLGEMMCTQFLQQILSNKLLLVVIVGLKKVISVLNSNLN